MSADTCQAPSRSRELGKSPDVGTTPPGRHLAKSVPTANEKTEPQCTTEGGEETKVLPQVAKKLLQAVSTVLLIDARLVEPAEWLIKTWN